MIVTFYTPGYRQDATELQLSCAEHGYDIECIAVSDSGSWAANCAKKARVIRDAIERHEHVLFLDADARINGNIDDLLQPCDGIRLHIVAPDQFRPGWFAQRYRYHAVRHGGMWNSGILSVSRSPAVIDLLDAWIDMADRCPEEWDQICLQRAHIESRSPVPVYDIAPQYRAGGQVIAHRSAFHRLWKTQDQKPLRKVLLIGSGYDLPEWWAQNGQKYIDAGFSVVAMNNAIAASGDHTYLWLAPNDYNGQHVAADYIPSNVGGYPRATNPEGNWINKPYWSKKPTTVMLSSLCHLLNEALLDKCELIVHMAGCDMIYRDGQTHFYGAGSCDPLRYGANDLVAAMNKISRMYARHNCRIFNVGNQADTLLTFKRGKL